MPTTDTSTPLFRALDDTDSADLLVRVASGRPGAWAELVRTYQPLLRSRVHRYRLQEADAHDVVQTTWLRLAQNLDRIHTPEHLAGWLATVVSRECLRVLRGESRTVAVADTRLASRPDVEPGPEDVALDADTARDLRSAIDTLPPQRRSLVRALFADDDRPYAEIAADLGMPIGSIGPTRARTLRELRRVLEQRGVDR